MKKSKLFLSLLSMCFALAVLCFGVYAANQVNYTLSGTISYEVTDAYVEVNTRVYKGAFRSAEDVYESIEGMAFGESPRLPAYYNYTQDLDITIPTYNTLNTNSDFEQEGIDITMNGESAVYVFEMTITNNGEIDVWVEPKPNWEDTLNVYQADSGVTTQIEQGDTSKTYIILAIDNPTASVEGGTYSVGLNIGAGDCPITNEYYSFEDYTNDNMNGYVIIGGNPPSDFVAPSFVNGVMICGILDSSFCENENIHRVYIPGTITFLEDSVFGLCTNLNTVRFEKGLGVSQFCSFDECPIESFRFPNNIFNHWGIAGEMENIPYFSVLWGIENGYATGDKGIATASDGVTKFILHVVEDLLYLDLSGLQVDYICDQAFFQSNIIEFTIPNSVKGIGSLIFKECYSITTVNFEGTITQWNTIVKANDWASDCQISVVHCSDGDVAI